MPVKKDRVIIDTNLWISFLLTKNYSKLDDLLSGNKIILLFDQHLISEFIEVAKRPKLKKYFTAADLQKILTFISFHAEFIEVINEVKICRDPKDDFLLALAKDGKASHLLTGDKDLLVIKKFGKTKITSMAFYLDKKLK
jgi:hypothetical protein